MNWYWPSINSFKREHEGCYQTLWISSLNSSFRFEQRQNGLKDFEFGWNRSVNSHGKCIIIKFPFFRVRIKWVKKWWKLFKFRTLKCKISRKILILRVFNFWPRKITVSNQKWIRAIWTTKQRSLAKTLNWFKAIIILGFKGSYLTVRNWYRDQRTLNSINELSL